MTKPQFIIRKAVASDAEQIWILMKELAIFERYINDFAITPDIVRNSGFKKSNPDFHCIIAADSSTIAGMLVYYYLPYTAQNRPAIYLKELYVGAPYRGQKIGEQLMHALREEARNTNCTQIKWTVAPWNEAGKRFYERLGATQDTNWLHYEWSI
ncbi:GNAT family N-acetyltransferase [Niabella sp.]|uniref:GNAT family N-acetyltransferase n=1 Tax=Niabella sp. TaxID=1962976 RepID=UPI0026132057|nr:GNAT family N-acetyltransferase [Niabella sp.]